MQIILEVPDKHAAHTLELLKGIKRVRVKSIAPTPLTPADIDFLAGLKQSLEDMKRHQRGEIELQSWDELYAELQAEEATEPPDSEMPEQLVQSSLVQQSVEKTPAQR